MSTSGMTAMTIPTIITSCTDSNNTQPTPRPRRNMQHGIATGTWPHCRVCMSSSSCTPHVTWRESHPSSEAINKQRLLLIGVSATRHYHQGRPASCFFFPPPNTQIAVHTFNVRDMAGAARARIAQAIHPRRCSSAVQAASCQKQAQPSPPHILQSKRVNSMGRGP